MSEWQSGQYEQRQPQWDERQSAIPEHLRRRDVYGQPLQGRQQGLRPEPRPQYQPPPQQPPRPPGPQQPPQRPRQTGLYAAWGCAAVAAVLAVAGWYTALKEHHSGTAATTAAAQPAAAQPDTEAAAKSAATSFLSLYSAQQYGQAWQYLTPAEQAEVTKSDYEQVHQQCASDAGGLAYKITGVTMDGKTAVITYTIAGAMSKLASATMAAQWGAAAWGVQPNDFSIYDHGSVKADVAAAKKAGDCAS
jgi:hypothetical protein